MNMFPLLTKDGARGWSDARQYRGYLPLTPSLERRGEPSLGIYTGEVNREHR